MVTVTSPTGCLRSGMAEHRVLAGLPDRDRDEVLAASTSRRYARNETVFHEGDPGNTLHLIVCGHVAVRVSTAMGDVATLTVLGAGDTFGELALGTPGSRRSASVVALDAVETLDLARGRVEALDPDVLSARAEQLGR